MRLTHFEEDITEFNYNLIQFSSFPLNLYIPKSLSGKNQDDITISCGYKPQDKRIKQNRVISKTEYEL